MIESSPHAVMGLVCALISSRAAAVQNAVRMPPPSAATMIIGRIVRGVTPPVEMPTQSRVEASHSSKS